MDIELSYPKIYGTDLKENYNLDSVTVFTSKLKWQRLYIGGFLFIF